MTDSNVAFTPPVALRTIFFTFLQIGLTPYGMAILMAILQKLRALVIGRGWLTEEESNEGQRDASSIHKTQTSFGSWATPQMSSLF